VLLITVKGHPNYWIDIMDPKFWTLSTDKKIGDVAGDISTDDGIRISYKLPTL